MQQLRISLWSGFRFHSCQKLYFLCFVIVFLTSKLRILKQLKLLLSCICAYVGKCLCTDYMHDLMVRSWKS